MVLVHVRPTGLRTMVVAVVAVAMAALLPSHAVAAPTPSAASTSQPAVAATPPMGWSSWSALRGNISEDKIKAEAQVMHDQLRSHGYQYVNIDSGWSDHLDAYGRDTWDASKFPDGMPALADYVHHLGLKLGLYLLPGIPKAAVAANTPIYGTPYHAADIADTSTEGNTYTDSWRIDYSKPGAQAYIQSYVDMFASWGVDYLKMDFVGPGGGQHPADNRADIEHWHDALQNASRPIHLELSNSLSFDDASTWQAYSNGWRIEGDVECYSSCPGYLTNWSSRVVKRFTDVPKWIPYAGPGHWNDLDSVEVGNGDIDGLTTDERRTVMTLWSIECSPLLLGTDLTKLDAADLPLITNDEVIGVDQEGVPGHPISQTSPQQTWFSKETDGSYVVALFNLASTPATVTATWSDLGFSGRANVRDLWTHTETAYQADGVTATLPAHGSRLLRVRPTRATQVAFDAAASSTVASPGQPVTVTATLSDQSSSPLLDTSARLTAPAGWVVDPASPVDLGTVGAGQQVKASWTVTAPADASTGPVRLPVSAGYTALGQTQMASTGVTVTVPSASLAAAYNNSAISDDTDTAAANVDGAGSSLSAQALAAAGAAPGATIESGGMHFTWPDRTPGQPDNVVAGGQAVELSGSGATLGLLATATYGPVSGSGQVVYTDGSSQAFTLNVPDWYAAPPAGSDVAIAMTYRNRPGNAQQSHSVSMYFVSVPLQAAKTPAYLVLPDVSSSAVSGTPAMHIFAMNVE
jgi:hypothetical protein